MHHEVPVSAQRDIVIQNNVDLGDYKVLWNTP